MKHKFNRDKFNQSKQAREELTKPHQPVGSIPGLRDRVKRVELAINIISSEVQP